MKYAGARSPSEADHPVGEDGEGVRLSEEQRLDWLRLMARRRRHYSNNIDCLLLQAKVNSMSRCCNLFPRCFNDLQFLPAFPRDKDATRNDDQQCP